MTEQAEHIVLYTEDHDDWASKMFATFSGLGIKVNHFKTNDAAQSYIAEVDHQIFDGALIDYHTFSSLSGVDFIIELAGSGVCGEILVLSSTTDRGTLERELEEKGYSAKVEIFDKFNEFTMAGIYITMRILMPDIKVTRIGILEAAGVEIGIFGNIRTDMFAIQDISRDLLEQIGMGEFNLEGFAQLVQEKVIQREKMLAELQ